VAFRFFSLTFIISWALFIAAAKAPDNNNFYFFIAICTPALVAIFLTGMSGGTTALNALLQRICEWRVGLQWYAFAIGYMLAIRFSAALIQRLAVGTWPQFSHLSWIAYAAVIVQSLPVIAGEEIGWRGYALPQLGAKMGFGIGSAVLGVLWAFWHFPLFFILPGSGNYGQSFPLFLLGTVALSIAMGWLFVHTKGSVLLATLMHSAVNATHEIVRSGFAVVGPFALNTTLIAWLTIALLWLAAAYFLFRMPRPQLR
jgi:membrane protease YdiL (CAAX protease family)